MAGALIPKAEAWPAQGLAQGPVYVVLWFDTEDYILPESDNAAKRIADYLTQQGVRATFKVVGEKARTLERTPYGPDSAAPPLSSNATVPWNQFSRTVLDVAGFLSRYGQLPPQVWLGSVGVPPESYLVALAQVSSTLIAKSEPPESVTVSSARLATSRYVAADSPSLWNWPIFPPGFHSPHLMELARLQAWTLKPAKLRGAT